MSWQPIETAPKDRPVLVASDYIESDGLNPLVHAQWVEGVFYSLWDGEPIYDATHWYPAPENLK